MKFAAILCIAVLAEVQSQSYEVIDERRFLYPPPPQAIYPIDVPCQQPYFPYPVELVETCDLPYAIDIRPPYQGFLPPIDIRPPCPNYLQPAAECVKKTIETSYPVGPSCQNCYPQIESVKQTIEICKEPSLPVDIPCSCSRPTFPVDLPCSRPTFPIDLPCSRPTFPIDLPCSRPTFPVDLPCSCSRPTLPVDIPCSCSRPTLPVDIPCSCSRPTLPVDIPCSCSRPTLPVDIPCSCSRPTLPAYPCNLPLPIPCQKPLTIPFIDTTLEDNSLPNSLANVLQMLVASKLYPNPCLQPSYDVIGTFDYFDPYPYLYTTEYLQPVYSSPPYYGNPFIL